jgi:hypothetical protein
LLFRDGLFEILKPPLNLPIVELFRAAAKSVASQTGQLQLCRSISASAARRMSCNVAGSSGKLEGAVNISNRLNRRRESHQMNFA